MMALMLVLVACGGNGGRDRGHDRDDDYEEDRDDEDRDEEEKDDEDKEVAEEEADKPASENVVVNTPSELGNDLYGFNIQLEGKLYTLPCPVSVFIENGFKINEKNSQMEIAADSYGWIELSYNNQTYRCIVDNYANYATVVQNCFVTTMETSIYGPEFDLVIPGNIKVGDSESAVLEIIKKFNYETETSGDFTYYEVSNPEGSILAGYEITVKEGKVISLEVEYDD